MTAKTGWGLHEFGQAFTPFFISGQSPVVPPVVPPVAPPVTIIISGGGGRDNVMFPFPDVRREQERMREELLSIEYDNEAAIISDA